MKGKVCFGTVLVLAILTGVLTGPGPVAAGRSDGLTAAARMSEFVEQIITPGFPELDEPYLGFAFGINQEAIGTAVRGKEEMGGRITAFLQSPPYSDMLVSATAEPGFISLATNARLWGIDAQRSWQGTLGTANHFGEDQGQWRMGGLVDADSPAALGFGFPKLKEVGISWSYYPESTQVYACVLTDTDIQCQHQQAGRFFLYFQIFRKTKHLMLIIVAYEERDPTADYLWGSWTAPGEPATPISSEMLKLEKIPMKNLPGEIQKVLPEIQSQLLGK